MRKITNRVNGTAMRKNRAVLRFSLPWLIAFLASLDPAGAAAAECGGDFAVWLDGVRAQARHSGLSEASVRLLNGGCLSSAESTMY